MSEKTVNSTFSAHYISGTHWDREWYRTFQEYRFVLVDMLDKLLELLETNPEFRHFHLDGQTCMLEDYTAIRPEKAGTLRSHIAQGRILVGPWYTMPDLFCPGDESLVRNLLKGRQVAEEWGAGAMPVAYTCDMFGHPSQMPQIYRGFDLPYCLLGRGTNEHNTPAFFNWKAPDGSCIFTFKLQDKSGYGALTRARCAVDDDGREAGEAARLALCEYLREEQKRTNVPVLCLIDAQDHIMPAMNPERYIGLIHETCSETSVKHSTLPQFFKEARDKIDSIPERTGEIRQTAKKKGDYLWLISNCVSARVGIKTANDACQALLTRWAEPLNAIAASGFGPAVPTRFLQIAWDNVLLNHAHDSICGCSIDQVHRDMLGRFEQAHMIAEQVRHRAFAALTRDCAGLARNSDEFTVTVANPLPRTRHDIVVFSIDLPPDYPATMKEGFNSQALKNFALEDQDGNPVPFQRLSFVPEMRERSDVARPGYHSDGAFTRYTVAAELELPPMGFTSLLVKPSDKPVRRTGTLRTGLLAAENEFLKIAAAPNGSLTLTDKESGQSYRDLLMFEDRSEVGDGWFHSESLNDSVHLSSASPAAVSVLHDGPDLVAFEISVRMNVPRAYDWAAERPRPETVTLEIKTTVTLRRLARSVDCLTTVDNTAEDHRLRLLLPSGASGAKTYIAHHPFDLVERPIEVNRETVDWKECDIPEKPFLGFQAVGDGRRGLAFISAGGLHEGGVAEDAPRTMLVTLLRSFRKTVGTSGESDGLEQGRHAFHYRLLPYSGRFPARKALDELAELEAGVLTRQTGRRSSGYPPMEGPLPPQRSFLKSSGSLVLSALKTPEKGGGMILRLWNPDDAPSGETLEFWNDVKDAAFCNLAEGPVSGEKPTVRGRSVLLTAGPRSIVTLRVCLV